VIAPVESEPLALKLALLSGAVEVERRGGVTEDGNGDQGLHLGESELLCKWLRRLPRNRR